MQVLPLLKRARVQQRFVMDQQLMAGRAGCLVEFLNQPLPFARAEAAGRGRLANARKARPSPFPERCKPTGWMSRRCPST